MKRKKKNEEIYGIFIKKSPVFMLEVQPHDKKSNEIIEIGNFVIKKCI